MRTCRVTAILNMPATPYWGVESRTRVTLSAPHHIDVRFSMKLTHSSPETDWVGLFWATYIDAREQALLFPGYVPGESAPRWIRGSSPSHMVRATWPFREETRDLDFVAGYPQRLFTPDAVGKERWALPLAYGVVDGVVVAFFIDKAKDARLTQSPLSAWDVQRVVHDWEVGRCYTFDQRIVVAPFVSPEEVVAEYNRWSGHEVPALGPEVPSAR